MEALQMLKFSLKKERMHFMKGWATETVLMTQDEDVVSQDSVLMRVSNHELSSFDLLLRALDDELDADEVGDAALGGGRMHAVVEGPSSVGSGS